jgi:hypothetical protein
MLDRHGQSRGSLPSSATRKFVESFTVEMGKRTAAIIEFAVKVAVAASAVNWLGLDHTLTELVKLFV